MNSLVWTSCKCHGTITLFPKDMPIRMCSAPIYIPMNLPFPIQCGINAPCILLKSAWRDILPHPISWRPRHGWSTQPTPPVGALGVKSDSQGLALIPLVTGPLPFSQKTCLLGCAAPPLIFPWTFPFLSNVGLMHPAYYLRALSVTRAGCDIWPKHCDSAPLVDFGYCWLPNFVISLGFCAYL